MLEKLLRDWPLKLLAVVLAFAIWVAVTGESRIVQDTRIPLDVELRSDRILAGSPPTEVGVRLRGSEAGVRHAMTGLVMHVDLRDSAPGERIVQLLPAMIRGLPPDVEIVQLVPDRLNLNVDTLAKRTVPVVPSFVGRPPVGYAFYGTLVTPDAVEVEGPESAMGGLSRLRTDPIHLDNRTAPFTARVGAVPESLELRVVDPRPVEVRVEVDTAPVETVLDHVPVVLADEVFEASVSPSTVRVSLSGPAALIGGIRAFQVRAVADLSGLAPKSAPYLVPLRVSLLDIPPADLARITARPLGNEKVSVRVTNRRISS